MSKQIIYLIAISTVFLFAGCDGGKNSADTMVDNGGQPQNALGYYGENVVFGPTPLLGEWEMEYLDDNQTFPEIILAFRSDGTGRFRSASVQYMYYGVSQEGDALYLMSPKFPNYVFNYTISNQRTDGCLEAVTHTPDPDNSLNNSEILLCKKEDIDPTPLLEGLNMGQPITVAGYYGEDVVLGDIPIVGTWNLHGFDVNTSGPGKIVQKIALSNDGTATIENFLTETSSIVYGTSTDGVILYFEMNDHYYQLTERYDAYCYAFEYLSIENNEKFSDGFFCKENN